MGNGKIGKEGQTKHKNFLFRLHAILEGVNGIYRLANNGHICFYRLANNEG